MFSNSLLFLKRGSKTAGRNTAASLAKRIRLELAREGTFQKSIRPCAVRLLFHVAHNDPTLKQLSPTAFVSAVNRSLAAVSTQLGPRQPVTMPMMRVLLDQDTVPLAKSKALIKGFSATSDRNHKDIAQQYHVAGSGLGTKTGSFYEQLTKEWALCDDIKEPHRRIATIFTLIVANGYQESYTAQQISDAKKRVSAKSDRFIKTFAYAASREWYCRRRLITDGSLHTVLRNGDQADIRKAAWILFFDASQQRFPRRPKKTPSPHMYELWLEWQQTPTARAMPFVERFVALLTRPDLVEMLEEAQKAGDAKERARNEKNKARFEDRQKGAATVEREHYDASAIMAKKKLSLSELAYKLQHQRMASAEMSALPTYVAVLRTSKPYRSPAATKVLNTAHAASCDASFSYASSEL